MISEIKRLLVRILIFLYYNLACCQSFDCHIVTFLFKHMYSTFLFDFRLFIFRSLNFRLFNFQSSNFKFPNSQFPIVSQLSPILNFSDPSDLLRSLTIGSDPSDPFRSLRSLRSLRSVPIPLISVISSTHTHCQYLSFLSLRMLVIVRTSFTRGARWGTRAGTCTAENEPCEVRKFELSEF